MNVDLPRPIPAEVQGVWKSRKTLLHTFLLIVFLGLPWLTIDGKPFLCLDIPQRHFHIFGLQLFSHDAPILFFIIFGFAILLALMTALYGRIWCGWFCPQTVFIERVYRQIEIWVEGPYRIRRQMRDSEMTLHSFLKICLKWSLFALVSLVVARSFLAYFNVSNFNVILVFTGLFLLNFGWFREQFCLIACPYGKVQSLMMDPKSVTVLFSESRQKDCVNCGRCSQVCPTGIDIRNGLQMECISCTACMDACDEIMLKVNQPIGLIRYQSSQGLAADWRRPRILVYLGIVLVTVMGLTFSLAKSSTERLIVLRGRMAPFLVTDFNEEKMVMNPFLLRSDNNGQQDLKVEVITPKDVILEISENPILSPKMKKMDFPFFIYVPMRQWPSSGQKKLELKMKINEKIITQTVELVGPSRP